MVNGVVGIITDMRSLVVPGIVLALVAHSNGKSVAMGSTPQPPFWPHYSGARSVTLLDGTWNYGLMMGDFDSMDPSFVPSASLTPNTTVVPMTMDAAPPGIMGPRGVAMYSTTFTQEAAPARLHFSACSFYCRVFVDGKEIGDHRAGGYVAFFLDVPAPTSTEATTRSLFVMADNRFNKTTAPVHTGGDFWDFGGLMRSVVLHDLPPVGATPFIWRAYAQPSGVDARQASMAAPTTVDISVILTDPKYSGAYSATVSFDGGVGKSMSATASNGVAVFRGVDVPNPTPWTTKNPVLHVVSVTGTGGDVVSERFGLRAWGTDKTTGRITLNGNVLKLHGWNHHTQWPYGKEGIAIGASPTDAQLDSDIALLKQAGTNYVRGAHYPQDPRWLDRLDEAGIAMWEEAHGPGVNVNDTQDPYFMKYQLQQINEMLDQSLNHASIMTWGYFNEGPSALKDACPAYAACANVTETRDPTRFTTWASNKGDRDVCLEHASLVSFNSYPGWYNHAGDLDEPKIFWDSMCDWVKSNEPGKPFVISETGAGGIYEWSHNTSAVKWTTAYQTEIISRDVDVALGNDILSGITLWHFYDFKGNDDATSNCGPCSYIPNEYPPTCAYFSDKAFCGGSRPGGENHKGVVDAWRRPKQAYAVVGAKYNASIASNPV